MFEFEFRVAVFEPFKDKKVDLIAPKLLYIALNVVCLGVGVWKVGFYC